MTAMVDMPRSALRPAALAGIGGLVVLIGLLVFWAGQTVIGGAVIVSGQAVVRGHPKVVQSLDGGIVAQIAVQNGDRVAAGQMLLRLDPTLLKVNLDVAMSRLAEDLARRARLQAEQAGLADPDFTLPELPFPPPDIRLAETGQRQIFNARVELMAGRAASAEEKTGQIRNQIEGTRAQIAAKRDQLTYLERELENMRALNELGLARQSQMLDLQRSRADLLGQIAALESDTARLVNAQRDNDIEALQQVRQFHEEVVTELREVTAEIGELIPQIVTTRTQLDRVEIRAPAPGIVHEMQLTTLGAVAAPGAVILEIIPLEDGVEFEVRLDPRQVDQVYPGQRAQVEIAAFDPRDLPRLDGRVLSVSPSTVTDPATGQAYYRVALELPEAQIARLGDVVLMPGMPVEAFLETGERTVMSYLLDPLSSQIARAFRER